MPYLVPSFADYIARLLSDPEIEKACCDKIDQAYEARHDISDNVLDVHNSLFMRTFRGPDDGLFLDRKEFIRLLFSQFYDQFHPHGLRKRGATASVGIFALAPLALDPSIRYLPEHLYFALFPGPKPPIGPELDEFVAPIMDQVADSWKRGIKLSRTALFRSLSLFQSMISLLHDTLVDLRDTMIHGYAVSANSMVATTYGTPIGTPGLSAKLMSFGTLRSVGEMPPLTMSATKSLKKRVFGGPSFGSCHTGIPSSC
jgi:hypothetical protein